MSHETRFHLPYPVFDTHFHALYMRKKDLDPETILTEAFSSNLVGALDVSTDVDDFDERRLFASGFSRLSISAGIHPTSTAENLDSRLEELTRQAALPEVIAVGETGLDNYHDSSPQQMQEQSFRFHLDLAARLSKPVIIHNREADRQVLEIISGSECRHGVFHCFSSDVDVARKALDFGFHISFAGNVTYKKNDELRRAAAFVPSDRLLVETDAPFLSPMPRRGRPNHPGHVGYTLDLLAETRDADPQELAVQLLENSLRLFAPAETEVSGT